MISLRESPSMAVRALPPSWRLLLGLFSSGQIFSKISDEAHDGRFVRLGDSLHSSIQHMRRDSVIVLWIVLVAFCRR